MSWWRKVLGTGEERGLSRFLFPGTTLLVLLFPVLCQWIPLAGVLEVEYATLSCLVLGFWGGLGGWRAAAGARARGEGHLRSWPWAARSLALVLYLLGVSLLLTWLVRDCHPAHGPALFLLMALPAPLIGLGTGSLARAWGRTSVRGLGWLLLLILVLLVLPSLIRMALLQKAPHNLLTGMWGFFSIFGHVAWPALTRSVTLIHRSGALAVAALLLALAETSLRRRSGRTAGRRGRVELALAGGLVAALLLGGDATGFGTGRTALRRALPATMGEGGLTIRFHPDNLSTRSATRLLEDALWHRRDLEKRLGLQGSGPITLWCFSWERFWKESVALSYGDLAAPWLGEATLLVESDGRSRALRHELAHLLAAAWSAPPLWASTDPGKTEGLATALAQGRDRGEVFQHRFAAALAVNRLPPAHSVFGVFRFWLGGQDVRHAYALAGSFVGFLLERFGPEAVGRWYGGAPAMDAFGMDLDQLDDAWRARLTRITTETPEREEAQRWIEKGARTAVHRTRCGRLRPGGDWRATRADTMAHEAIEGAWREERWDEVLRLLDEVTFSPSRDRDRRVRLAVLQQAQERRGRPEEAIAPIEAALEDVSPDHPDYPLVLTTLLRALLAADRPDRALEVVGRLTKTSVGHALAPEWLASGLRSHLRQEITALYLERDHRKQVEAALVLLDRLPAPENLGSWIWTRAGLRPEEEGWILPVARALAARGERVSPEVRADVHAWLARWNEKSGDLAAARESWLAVQRLHPQPEGQVRAGDQSRRVAWRLERVGRPPPDS